MSNRILKQPWQAAVLIAELMRRSEKPRIRLSHKNLSRFAGRIKLSNSIIDLIEADLREYGYVLIRLNPSNNTAGYVVMKNQSLFSSRPLNINNIFSKEERKEIVKGTFNFDVLHFSLINEEEEEDDDDEIDDKSGENSDS